MNGKTWIQLIKYITRERFFRTVKMVSRNTEIEIVVSVSRSIVKCADGKIKMTGIFFTVSNSFKTGNRPSAVVIKFIFKIEFGTIDALIAIGSLEANTYLMQAILVNPFMVSRSDGNKIAGKGPVRSFISHCHDSYAPCVKF